MVLLHVVRLAVLPTDLACLPGHVLASPVLSREIEAPGPHLSTIDSVGLLS